MSELKMLAEKYLGAHIPQELFEMVLPAAQRKLEWIISREGDADGQRLKPHYSAQLISEEIKAEIFEYQCKKHYEDKKRAAQKLDSPQSQPHYSTTNTGLSRAMSY